MGYFLQKLAEAAEEASEGGTSGLAKSMATGAGAGLGVGVAGAGLAVGGAKAHAAYKKYQGNKARAARKTDYQNQQLKGWKADGSRAGQSPYRGSSEIQRERDLVKNMRKSSRVAKESGARASRVLGAVKRNAKWAAPALALSGAAAGAAKHLASKDD